jgi:NAD(P)H-dependent FMN reductase
MAILGFSSSPTERESNLDRMVKAILAATGKETEFIKLAELNYMGCRGCAAKCAGKELCPVEDDLKPYFPKIKEAEALVIGTVTYFGAMNSFTFSFLERFYAFRHIKMTLQGKPTTIVAVGGMEVDGAAKQLKEMLEKFGVNIIDTIKYSSQNPPCFTCGHHTECKIGGLYKMMGEKALSFQVTPDCFHRWEDSEEIRATVVAAGKNLQEVYTAHM